LIFADRSGFCGRRSFQGSKKGKKGQKEQKRNIFAIFAPFLPFLLPKKESNPVKERDHKIRCSQQISNPQTRLL
jgi:hypothetical protein